MCLTCAALVLRATIMNIEKRLSLLYEHGFNGPSPVCTVRAKWDSWVERGFAPGYLARPLLPQTEPRCGVIR